MEAKLLILQINLSGCGITFYARNILIFYFIVYNFFSNLLFFRKFSNLHIEERGSETKRILFIFKFYISHCTRKFAFRYECNIQCLCNIQYHIKYPLVSDIYTQIYMYTNSSLLIRK